MTNNVRRRLDEHKQKLVPGFTARYNINRLVDLEVFEDVRNAIDCEKKVKPWTRAKRVALVESKNPKWDDLSRDGDQPHTFRLVS
jgi:putative endonuclease